MNRACVAVLEDAAGHLDVGNRAVEPLDLLVERGHGLAREKLIDAPLEECAAARVEHVEDGAAEQLVRSHRAEQARRGRVEEHDSGVVADQDAVGRELHQTAVPFVRLQQGSGPFAVGSGWINRTILVMAKIGVAGRRGRGFAESRGRTYNACESFMSDIGKERFQQLLFYALVFLMGYLAYLVLGPFLPSLAWAAVFAMMFHSVHVEMTPRIGANRAALATTLMAAILIVAPAVTLVSVFAREVPQVVERVRNVTPTSPAQIQRLWNVVRDRSPVTLPENPSALLRDGIQRALTFLAPRAGAVVADVFATIGSLFVMLFALFFLLRDGESLGRQVRELLPLPDRERDRLMRETRDMVIASVGAALLVAVVQGAIGGLAFLVVGIAAPVIWGVVMAFCSLIPLVGAALVWVPAALWLAFSGEIWRAVTLTVFGVLGISMADNVLRPLLLAGRTSASGLVVFLGILGGAAAFGFIGLVIGPIVLVTAGNLIRVFTRPELVDASPASLLSESAKTK